MEAARIRSEAIRRAENAYVEAGLADAQTGVAAALDGVGDQVGSPTVEELYGGVGDSQIRVTEDEVDTRFILPGIDAEGVEKDTPGAI